MTDYIIDSDDIGCLNDYFYAMINGEENKVALTRLFDQEIGVIKSHPLSEHDAQIKEVAEQQRGCLTCLAPDCTVWQTADQNCWKSEKEALKCQTCGGVVTHPMCDTCYENNIENTLQEALKAERERVRPEVWQFALLMEKKLKENDHKKSWKKCKILYLIERLKDEIKELEDCFWIEDSRSDFINIGDDFMIKGKYSEEDVIKECADVSNFSMMIAWHMIESLRKGDE